MLQTYERNSQKKLAATIVAILVIAGAVVFADQMKAKSAVATTSASPTMSSATPVAGDSATNPITDSTDTSSSSSAYKDGTYTGSSSYYVPHGSENIAVSLTVSSGVVTAVSIQNSEGDRESAEYQADFASAYKSYIVGKQISGLRLGIIAGASDTTQGFNEALNQIAAKAQA